MIVKNTQTLKEHLSVNGSVDYDNIKPYLKKAERVFLKPIIGFEQLQILSLETQDTVIKQAQSLAQEAVCNYAYYIYLPIGSVQITDSGIHVVSNENVKSASDKQFKELQRSFKKSAHEALDELLEYMEANVTKFEEWSSTNHYTIHKELLVNKTAVFNDNFYIFNSRQTFIALRPTLKVVQDQFIIPAIGITIFNQLKETKESVGLEVKKLIQKSMVAFCIMKTVDNGMFVLDAKGMHMRFDVLPYEKTVTNVNLKINDFLVHSKESKKIEGEEYLKLAIKMIKENTNLFSSFELKKHTNRINLTKTKSMVGL